MDQFLITVNQWMAGSIGLAALGCFLWGMISVLLSPCHLASIPLIVGYVAGQNRTLGVRHAAGYAVAFSAGLFVTIAVVGVVCAALGRMLGEIGPYWTILVGSILVWVSLDMLGVEACSMSGGAISRIKVRGVSGALVLGLAYGLLSGSCTFGFIAPILAYITIQEEIAAGAFLITLFGIGHCLPIAAAGSSAALVQRVLENGKFHRAGIWFRGLAGVAIGAFGLYLIARPFVLA